MPSLRFDRRRLLLAGMASAVLPTSWAVAAPASLTVEVAVNGWTALADWADALKPRVVEWWPRINGVLGVTAPGPKTVRLELVVIKPDGIPAATERDRIMIDAPYVQANLGNPDMLRMIAHELVHVAQAYPEGTGPGWLVEGIADYVRYYVLFPDDPARAFDPAHADWRTGYSPTAGMLAWILTRWPAAVTTVNAAMREGRNGEAVLTKVTGAQPETLWRDYLASRPDAASAARRQTYLQSLKKPAAKP